MVIKSRRTKKKKEQAKAFYTVRDSKSTTTVDDFVPDPDDWLKDKVDPDDWHDQQPLNDIIP